MVDTEVVDLGGIPAIRGSLTVAGRSLSVLNVHTLPPIGQPKALVWKHMMAQVAELIRHAERPLIVGGDLNATPHAAWYERLLANGVRGAHESRGRGLAATWPNSAFLPSLIRLDHLLVSPGVDVLDVREGKGRGSDHRPIAADLALW